MIALMLYYGLHSLLASTSVKHWLQRYWISPRYYRLLYNVVAVLTLFPIAYLYSTSKAHFLLSAHWGLQILGLLAVGIGLYIVRAAMRNYDLGEFSGLAQYQNAGGGVALGELNIKGWNAIVRHPLYLGSIILVWGVFLIRPHDLLFSVALITTLYSYLGASWEEIKLSKAFGDTYQAYQKQVPMLFPFLKRKRS